MSDLTKKWNLLDYDHKKFILRVRNSNGSKHGAQPTSIDSTERCAAPNSEYFKSIALWHKAEDSGFIKCVSSYSWIVTAQFGDLERELFNIGKD